MCDLEGSDDVISDATVRPRRPVSGLTCAKLNPEKGPQTSGEEGQRPQSSADDFDDYTTQSRKKKGATHIGWGYGKSEPILP